jgi:CspA family cold shock protein
MSDSQDLHPDRKRGWATAVTAMMILIALIRRPPQTGSTVLQSTVAAPWSQERAGPRGTATLGSGIRRVAVCLFVMANGTVDFFNTTDGYGFISTEDADEDVFFHMFDIGGADLNKGTEIEFEIEQAPKGPRATNVVRT